MYSIEILPIAREDLVGIARYVAETLWNAPAAEQLSQKLIDAIYGLQTFPYRHAVYQPLKDLQHEYRALRVDNYLIFYWVDEEPATITIARVLYAKSDIAARF